MTTNQEFLSGLLTHDSWKLEVVCELMEKAHPGKRKDGVTPQTEHNFLVCNLVDWFGQRELQDYHQDDNNEFRKELLTRRAVALLHDALEDGPRYKHHHDLLRTDLIEALERRYCERTQIAEPPLSDRVAMEAWADEVYAGVKALTRSPATRRFNKVDQARALAPQWKPIKSIDQTASIIGDILNCKLDGMADFDAHEKIKTLKKLNKAHADLSTAPPEIQLLDLIEHNQRRALKALDVSRALSEGTNHDDPYHEFHKRCYIEFVKMYDLVHGPFGKEAKAGNCTAAANVQKQFNIERVLEKAYTARGADRVQLNEPRVTFYERGHLPDLHHGGLTEIAVLQNDPCTVARFSMWEGTGNYPHAEELSDKFAKRLEHLPGVKVITMPNIDGVREFAINRDSDLPNNKRLDLMELLKIAALPDINAIDKTYLHKIQLLRREVFRPEDGPPVSHCGKLEGKRFESVLTMLAKGEEPAAARKKTHKRIGPSGGDGTPGDELHIA